MKYLSCISDKRFSRLTLAVVGVLVVFYLSSSFVLTATFTQPLPVPDFQKIDEVFSTHAINNTVVIVPTNAGHLHWVENLLCSLQATSFDASRIVFWALDTRAQSILASRNHTTYHDPRLFSTTENENFKGDTSAYKRMMRERPKFYIDVLSAGFDILMLDADTIFWQSPLSIVPQDDRVDISYSTDAREFYQSHDAFLDERRRGPYIPPVCNGIFWMKSSPQTIALWTEMISVFESWSLASYFFRKIRFQDDQRGMDYMLNDGRAQLVPPFPSGITAGQVPLRPPTYSESRRNLHLNVQLLDQTQVVNGQLLLNRHEQYQQNLASLRKQGGDRIAAHFNWYTKAITKEQGARELDMLFLDREGACTVK